MKLIIKNYGRTIEHKYNKQMKYIMKEVQDPRKKILTKDGVLLNLIGRGSVEIKEKAERFIGALRFYKVTSAGQVIGSLNGASPYINYYLPEEDVRCFMLHGRNKLVTSTFLLES